MDLTKASAAGKRNHVLKMSAKGIPDAYICEVLGVSAGFIAKTRHDAGLTKYQGDPSKAELLRAAKADVQNKIRNLAKTLEKGSSPQDYVPRLVRALKEKGVSKNMLYSCFPPDQQDLVTKVLAECA